MTVLCVRTVSFDRTYEELKLFRNDQVMILPIVRFDRTYEELKHAVKRRDFIVADRFDRTYEELKLLDRFLEFF